MAIRCRGLNAMQDLIELSVICWVSLWCDWFHKKHHEEALEVGGRWCGKCLCYYFYPKHR